MRNTNPLLFNLTPCLQSVQHFKSRVATSLTTHIVAFLTWWFEKKNQEYFDLKIKFILFSEKNRVFTWFEIIDYLGQLACRPPDTCNSSAVTNDAASDARNAIALATSSGCPIRPSGWTVATCSTHYIPRTIHGANNKIIREKRKSREVLALL